MKWPMCDVIPLKNIDVNTKYRKITIPKVRNIRNDLVF